MHRKNEQEIAPKYWCGHLWVGELWVVFFPSNFYESEHFICKMLGLSPPLPLYYLLLCTQWRKPGLAGSWGGGPVFTSAALHFLILLGGSRGGSRQCDEWGDSIWEGVGGQVHIQGWVLRMADKYIPQPHSRSFFLFVYVPLFWFFERNSTHLCLWM